MSSDKGVQIGRLAMRHEGSFWNAYYASPNSMKDAVLLGSIAIKFVESHQRKDAFMGLMRDAVADIIESQTGRRPTWPDGVQLAPEAERAGHAMTTRRTFIGGVGGAVIAAACVVPVHAANIYQRPRRLST